MTALSGKHPRWGTICVVLGLSAFLAVCGPVSASATTVRTGTTAALPSAASPTTANGTRVGSASLVNFNSSGNAAPGVQFTTPTTSQGFCTLGALSGDLAGNGSTPVTLAAPTLRFGSPATSTAVNCTDTNTTWDFVSFELTSAGGMTATASSLMIAAPKFSVRIKYGGVVTACQGLGLVPPNTTMVATLSRGTSTSGFNVPKASFSNVQIYYPGQGGTCTYLFGNSSSPIQRTAFSASFGPLKEDTSGKFLGFL